MEPEGNEIKRSTAPEDGVTEAEPEAKSKSGLRLPRVSFKFDFTPKNLLGIFVTLSAIIAIMYLAVYVRSGTLGAPTVLDYDPWWFYRHAKELLENGLQVPEWDELSYFPPGRPYEAFQGWAYIIAIFYKILEPLLGFTLTEAAKWSTLIMAAITVIPAFLLGRSLSNKLAGICTAIFGVLTPTLIGVSMAGYCDSDMVVVFYSFLSVYSILLAMKREVSIKSIPYYIFAIIVNLAFAYTWGYGWIILLFFTFFIPAFLIFRILEQMIHNKGFRLDLAELKKETRIIIPLIGIIVVTNIIGSLLNLGSIVEVSILGLTFIQGKLLLVNVSVAELQQTNVLSEQGIQAIIGRVGLAPIAFTLFLPLLVFYRLYKKEKINFAEVFLFLWVIVAFMLINYGVRFSILFSSAAAVSAGYTIGNALKYLNRKILRATFLGFTGVMILIFISNAVSTGYVTGGMEISGNWYGMLDWIKSSTDQKALIVTWWDPGHIIAGYTDRRVMADGAHCGVGICVPYNHDVRIQDMGRVFSISDEDEAISILKKYRQLTSEQCAEVRKIFGSKVPADACDQVPDMYVIASSDLIAKYYWLTYFGTGTGRNYFQVQITNYDPNQGVITYGGGTLLLSYKDGKWVPLLNFPQQGIRNAVVRKIVYFENGNITERDYGTENTIDGMVWVDANYQVAIFMDPQTRDSLFNRMFFFNGGDLKHFELIYQNPEIRLFKVVW